MNNQNYEQIRQAAIAEITSAEYGKRFIIVTRAKRYYPFNAQSLTSLSDAIKSAGIAKDDAIIVDNISQYSLNCFYKVLFDPNGEFIEFLRFTVVSSLQGINWGGGRVRGHVRYEDTIRLFKNRTFVRYTDEFNSNPNAILPKKRFAGAFVKGDDIECKHIRVWSASYDCYKEFSESNTEKIKDFFVGSVAHENDINTIKSINSFVSFVTKTAPNTKAVKKRIDMIDNEFRPLIENINFIDKILPKPIDVVPKDYEISEYSKDFFHPFAVRNGEYIIIMDSKYNAIIYNVTTKKKWMANLQRFKIKNIGVFNIDRLSIAYSCNMGNGFNKAFFQYYKNGTYSYWHDSVQILFDTYDKLDYVACYDANGNPISPIKCFEGTMLPDLINSAAEDELRFDTLIKKKESSYGYNEAMRTHYITTINALPQDHFKVKNFTARNMAPRIFVLSLFLKDKYRLSAEQLAKLKLYNILYSLVSDQNGFRGKDEESSGYSYWKSTVIVYNTKQTNIKNAFGMNMNLMRALDEHIKKTPTSITYGYLANANLMLGDKLKYIDAKLYADYLDYFATQSVTQNQVRQIKDGQIKELLPYIDNPKLLLEMLKKIGQFNTWTDYLRMRNQMIDLATTNPNITFDPSKYKIFPEKATRFIQFREYVEQGYYERVITIDQQWDINSNRYKDIQKILDDKGKTIGCLVKMTPAENTRFLHDDLFFWLSFYRNTKKDELFKIAVERVKKYEWSDDKICIVAPRKANDVQNEGAILHHCVASFVDPIINGTENILFIRKKEMANVPWYTMAIDNDGCIEQIHCYSNLSLSEQDQKRAYDISEIPSYEETIDLIPRLLKWAKQTGASITSIHSAYGALCAHR